MLLENIDRLYAGLRQILARHHGTLSNYVGDAFFATWEAAAPDSAAAGVALWTPPFGGGLCGRGGRDGAADRGGPGPARSRGRPAADGLGRRLGPAAVSQLTGMLVTVLGDATNVAFRLSGLAGRDGRPDVLVTDAVYRATAAAFAFTPPSAIQVKGRTQAVEALGASRL